MWISIMWNHLTNLTTMYSGSRNVTLKMAALLAETCRRRYHNKNTSVELSAFCWYLIHIILFISWGPNKSDFFNSCLNLSVSGNYYFFPCIPFRNNEQIVLSIRFTKHWWHCLYLQFLIFLYIWHCLTVLHELDIGRSVYHFLQYVYIPMRYTM